MPRQASCCEFIHIIFCAPLYNHTKPWLLLFWSNNYNNIIKKNTQLTHQPTNQPTKQSANNPLFTSPKRTEQHIVVYCNVIDVRYVCLSCECWWHIHCRLVSSLLVVFCVACLFRNAFTNRITKKSKKDRVSIVQGGYVSQSANKSLSVSKKANILNKAAVGTSKSASSATLGSSGGSSTTNNNSSGSAPVSGITVSIHFYIIYSI